jgi:hypothetical protein
MDTSKPVDHPDGETVDVRQGTGPRATVSVLLISLLMAAVAGVVIVGYFNWIR